MNSLWHNVFSNSVRKPSTQGWDIFYAVDLYRFFADASIQTTKTSALSFIEKRYHGLGIQGVVLLQ
jgi:hypothetical protein